MPLPRDEPHDPLKAALAAKARDGAPGSMRARVIAEGEDWHALDVLCTAGPDDRAYEEVHDRSSVSVVLAGTFHYRAEEGAALMTPGAVLLGERGRCFACGHEHGEGDRCVSFHPTPVLALPSWPEGWSSALQATEPTEAGEQRSVSRRFHPALLAARSIAVVPSAASIGVTRPWPASACTSAPQSRRSGLRRRSVEADTLRSLTEKPLGLRRKVHGAYQIVHTVVRHSLTDCGDFGSPLVEPAREGQ